VDGLRKLACAAAALVGLPAPQPSAHPLFESRRPASNPDWGSRPAPADPRIDNERLSGGTAKPGFQSSAALSHRVAWALPGGATFLANPAADSLLHDASAGLHSGRSPPRNA
jgi:hypothetical protein